MLKLILPQDSRPVKGCQRGDSKKPYVNIKVYRYNADNNPPKIDSYKIETDKSMTVLCALNKIKESLDPTLSYRKSCREGSCGSCAMNINKKNGLACTTRLSDLGKEVEIYPLPHMFVVKDLICDMSNFYKQYEALKPWFATEQNNCSKNNKTSLQKESIQTQEDRSKLDGLYECVMCGACSTQCPSYWWNTENFAGPAALLSALRFIEDSRDSQQKEDRLSLVDSIGGIKHCHSIFSCTTACPKGLNTADAIAKLSQIVKKNKK
ncbi:MAG: succinate dehydrogenase iron-sulfur subunit [Alphaproteobacteria bacterium]|nr:succinate dehydrogenase iron-sulfur subunit [Rickettsiales bacterium]